MILDCSAASAVSHAHITSPEQPRWHHAVPECKSLAPVSVRGVPKPARTFAGSWQWHQVLARSRRLAQQRARSHVRATDAQTQSLSTGLRASRCPRQQAMSRHAAAARQRLRPPLRHRRQQRSHHLQCASAAKRQRQQLLWRSLQPRMSRCLRSCLRPD